MRLTHGCGSVGNPGVADLQAVGEICPQQRMVRLRQFYTGKVKRTGSDVETLWASRDKGKNTAEWNTFR